MDETAPAQVRPDRASLSPREPPTPLLRVIAVLAIASTMLLSAPTALALSESRRFSDFAIDNWTVAEGLPQVAVQSLAQDGDGYV